MAGNPSNVFGWEAFRARVLRKRWTQEVADELDYFAEVMMTPEPEYHEPIDTLALGRIKAITDKSPRLVRPYMHDATDA